MNSTEEKCYELSNADYNGFQLIEEHKWFPEATESLPDSFELMREELNGVKSLLNCMPLSKWHKHTRHQNPAGFVISEVRKKANPELLTQAWCKFTEVLFRFPKLVPLKSTQQQVFRSLHLCEAPGAFITALNQFIKVNNAELKWEWTGTTLNPYYEGNTTGTMINDDRFILRTLDNWDFGIDDTGNLLKSANLRHFTNKYNQKIDLVTADGSIDCQTDPARQESLVIDLHFSEIITALGCLNVGGNFVLKMFTFFEAGTVCHLYLLSCVFDKVSVFKPTTSKEGNSEVYVICQSFRGIEKSSLEILISNFGKEPVFDVSDIPPDFIKSAENCGRYFMEIQISVIRRNIDTFGFDPNEKESRKLKMDEKKMLAKNFINAHKICALNPKDMIVSSQAVDTFVDDIRQADERVDIGTFMDKCHKKTEEEALKSLHEQLINLYPSWLPRCRKLEWVPLNNIAPTHPEFHIIKGAPFSQINSSKFCPCRAIKLYKQSLTIKSNKSGMSPTHMKQLKKRKLDLIPFYPLKSLVVQTPILASVTKICPDLLNKSETFVIKVPNVDNILNNDENTIIELIDQLIKVLSEMKKGHNLILLNTILFTRLQVGLLFILLVQFEQIGFLRPIKDSHGLLLSDFKEPEQVEWKNRLEQVKETLKSHTETVLSMSHVEHITQEPIYSMIVAHNINIMRETSQFLLKQ